MNSELEGNDFRIETFGEDAIEQISNMRFSDAQKKIIDFAFYLEDFDDEELFDLAFFFAQNNGLNTHE